MGTIYSPFLRLIDDGYEDGLEEMSNLRTAETPRSDSNVANTARGMNDNLSPETTSDMATMAFQILTHELMSTKKVQVSVFFQVEYKVILFEKKKFIQIFKT